jgi:hypothetical protein
MPPMGGKQLSPSEVSAVAAYVWALGHRTGGEAAQSLTDVFEVAAAEVPNSGSTVVVEGRPSTRWQTKSCERDALSAIA